MRHGRNHLFDGMRGVAALLVMVFHIGKAIDAGWVSGGYLAVDFFFVLSGAVIARAYDDRLASGMTTGDFMAARLARLYPMFAVGLGIGLAWRVILIAAGRATGLGGVALGGAFNALMLPSPIVPGMLFPVDVPAWSLFFELVANVVYALALCRLSRRAIAAIAVVGAVAMALGAMTHGELNLGFDWATAYVGLGRVAFSFSAGVLIVRARRPGIVVESDRAVLIALLLVAALVVPVAANVRPAFDLGLAIVAFPALVWFGTSVDLRRGTVGAAWLGAVSYPLYAVHIPLLHVLTTFRGKLGLSDGVWAVAASAIVIAVAAVLSGWIEPAARTWLSRAIGRFRALQTRLPIRRRGY